MLYRSGLTREIIGAAMAVHRELGPGLLESAYHACLAYELHERGRTLVMVTHEAYIADQTQRTIILRDGKIERDDRNGDVNSNHRNTNHDQTGGKS